MVKNKRHHCSNMIRLVTFLSCICICKFFTSTLVVVIFFIAVNNFCEHYNNLTTVLSVSIHVFTKGLIDAETPFNHYVHNQRVIGGHNATPNTWRWQVKPIQAFCPRWEARYIEYCHCFCLKCWSHSTFYVLWNLISHYSKCVASSSYWMISELKWNPPLYLCVFGLCFLLGVSPVWLIWRWFILPLVWR